MNQFTGIGRLTKDIELKETSGGLPYARFIIALDRRKSKEGNKKNADFPSVVAYGKTASNLSKYSGKGLRIAIRGRIETGSYEKDGKTIYTTDIIADQVEFLDWKGDGNTANQNSDIPEGFAEFNDDDEDIPF